MPRLRNYKTKNNKIEWKILNGDFTLPGYKYLGPGNRMDKGPPNGYNDAVAYDHDGDYDAIQKQGENPYVKWSDADQKALNRFTHDDYGGTAGIGFFSAKKGAYKAGLIGKVGEKTQKRLRHVESAIENHPRSFVKKQRLRDGESSSVINLPPDDNMSGQSQGGSGNEHGLKETPVDTPFHVTKGLPNYDFAYLPYNEIRGVNTTGANYWSVDHTYRLTSPYDPAVTLTTIDINTGTGVTNSVVGQTAEPDGEIVQANWFSYYASIYNYYSVIRCDWKVYIENKGGADIVVHQLIFNDEFPPVEATSTDIMNWPGVKTKYLSAPYSAVLSTGKVETNGFNYDTNPNVISLESDGAPGGVNYEAGNNVTSRGGHVSCEFTGSYEPGDYTREIRLDSQVENWTSVSANPLLPERLAFRIKPETSGFSNASATNSGGDLTYKIVAEINYLVEFKELKAGLRWPVQRQPAIVSINSNPNTQTA